MAIDAPAARLFAAMSKGGKTMQLDAKLPEHKVVPLWILPDKHGETINLAKRRGRAHMLLLVCTPGADPTPFVETLAPTLAELRDLPVQGIAVVASEDEAGALPSSPFTVVIDAAGKVRGQYLPPDACAGLFALDRYGTLYHQWLAGQIADLPAATEVAEWMQAIGMQCSI